MRKITFEICTNLRSNFMIFEVPKPHCARVGTTAHPLAFGDCSTMGRAPIDWYDAADDDVVLNFLTIALLTIALTRYPSKDGVMYS